MSCPLAAYSLLGGKRDIRTTMLNFFYTKLIILQKDTVHQTRTESNQELKTLDGNLQSLRLALLVSTAAEDPPLPRNLIHFPIQID